jgi:hypothetical protein
MRRIILQALWAAPFLIPQTGQDVVPAVGTNIGEMYPDFYLPKLDGSFGRLSDYRGSKVLLIHFASW